MRILETLSAMLASVGRYLGLVQARAPVALPAEARQRELAADPTPLVAIRSEIGAAVAGFVKRAPADRLLLSRRLASVAQLNTPAGRKPRCAPPRPVAQSQVPRSRLGSKRTSRDDGRGLRVLAKRPAARPTAVVIPFPVRSASTAVAVVGDTQIASAA